MRNKILYFCVYYFAILICDVLTRSSTISCPPWSLYNESLGKCECPSLLRCDDYGYIEWNCISATFNNVSNFTEIGYCVFGCNTKAAYAFPSGDKLLWNKVLCDPYGRTGSLCGSCQTGLFQPVYSYDLKCVKCSNPAKNVCLYIMLAFVPLTVFCLILLHLQLNIVTSPIFGFVFYSQLLANPFFIRALLSTELNNFKFCVRMLGVVFGVWNLDFFRSFNKSVCFEINTLPTLLLDFVVALYPLLLMVSTYIFITLYNRNCTPVKLIGKPLLLFFSYFKCNRNNTSTSLINSFSTYILLSNVKLFSTSVDILTPVTLYRFTTPNNVTEVTRLYYDATITYFGYHHLPYAILAIAILSALVFLPIIVLILYPFKWFQRIKNYLPSRYVLFLNTFVDSFQGCYKDGSKPPGSRDYRILAALPFIIRLLFFFVYSANLGISLLPQAGMILVFSAILIIILDPIQEQFEKASYSWVLYTLLLACFTTAIYGIQVAINLDIDAYKVCFIAIAFIVNFTSLFGPLLKTLHHYATKCGWFKKLAITEE